MKKRAAISIVFLSICCLYVRAQKTGLQPFAMSIGEKCDYDVYFKWGLIFSRAGEANFTYCTENSVSDATLQYNMLFKSTKFYDSFFKMRDTLITYYNNNNDLIYSIKNSDEGNYYSIDKITFNKQEEKTIIHSLRYVPPKLKIDTTMITTGNVVDLLGVIYYLRGVNRLLLQSGDIIPLTVAIGKDLVNIQFIYQNQAIVERGNVKYNTHYFKIDIFDDAFESMKTAAEVWVGNDDNFIPIKVRSKLKIGYAEIYYKSSSSLAHPLSCSIIVKK